MATASANKAFAPYIHQWLYTLDEVYLGRTFTRADFDSLNKTLGDDTAKMLILDSLALLCYTQNHPDIKRRVPHNAPMIRSFIDYKFKPNLRHPAALKAVLEEFVKHFNIDEEVLRSQIRPEYYQKLGSLYPKQPKTGGTKPDLFDRQQYYIGEIVGKKGLETIMQGNWEDSTRLKTLTKAANLLIYLRDVKKLDTKTYIEVFRDLHRKSPKGITWNDPMENQIDSIRSFPNGLRISESDINSHIKKIDPNPPPPPPKAPVYGWPYGFVI